MCQPRHRHHGEWLKFLRLIDRKMPKGMTLHMVGRFFRDITDKRIRRDSFTSVPELELEIDLYVAEVQFRVQALHLDRQRLRHPGQGHAGQGDLGISRSTSTEQRRAPH
jgi:hypothetical protein